MITLISKPDSRFYAAFNKQEIILKSQRALKEEFILNIIEYNNNNNLIELTTDTTFQNKIFENDIIELNGFNEKSLNTKHKVKEIISYNKILLYTNFIASSYANAKVKRNNENYTIEYEFTNIAELANIKFNAYVTDYDKTDDFALIKIDLSKILKDYTEIFEYENYLVGLDMFAINFLSFNINVCSVYLNEVNTYIKTDISNNILLYNSASPFALPIFLKDTQKIENYIFLKASTKKENILTNNKEQQVNINYPASFPALAFANVDESIIIRTSIFDEHNDLLDYIDYYYSNATTLCYYFIEKAMLCLEAQCTDYYLTKKIEVTVLNDTTLLDKITFYNTAKKTDEFAIIKFKNFLGGYDTALFYEKEQILTVDKINYQAAGNLETNINAYKEQFRLKSLFLSKQQKRNLKEMLFTEDVYMYNEILNIYEKIVILDAKITDNENEQIELLVNLKSNEL